MTVAITMQRQSTGMAAASLTTTTAAAAAVGANSTPTMVVRPTLPDRRVTAATIEDAYVRFILYCNPAVPLSTDTTALREAFRSPPKSGGKSFSTFTLFELIKQLDNKSIKTWAELALRLGVDPPDQDKGQSSQKIQQYAVRLKVCGSVSAAYSFLSAILCSREWYLQICCVALHVPLLLDVLTAYSMHGVSAPCPVCESRRASPRLFWSCFFRLINKYLFVASTLPRI